MCSQAFVNCFHAKKLNSFVTCTTAWVQFLVTAYDAGGLMFWKVNYVKIGEKIIFLVVYEHFQSISQMPYFVQILEVFGTYDGSLATMLIILYLKHQRQYPSQLFITSNTFFEKSSPSLSYEWNWSHRSHHPVSHNCQVIYAITNNFRVPRINNHQVPRSGHPDSEYLLHIENSLNWRELWRNGGKDVKL